MAYRGLLSFEVIYGIVFGLNGLGSSVLYLIFTLCHILLVCIEEQVLGLCYRLFC
jgi:hypothetical protein